MNTPTSPSSAGTAGEPSREACAATRELHGYDPNCAFGNFSISQQCVTRLIDRHFQPLRGSLRQAEAERDDWKKEAEERDLGWKNEQLETAANRRNLEQTRSNAQAIIDRFGTQLTALQASRDALVKERDGLVAALEGTDGLVTFATKFLRHADSPLREALHWDRAKEMVDAALTRYRAARASTGQTGGEL